MCIKSAIFKKHTELFIIQGCNNMEISSGFFQTLSGNKKQKISELQANALSVNATTVQPEYREKIKFIEEPIKKIPHHAHMVWLGSEMPDYGLRNVYRFLESNGFKNNTKSLDAYKLTIWTDSPKKILTSLYLAEASDDPLLSSLALKHNKLLEENKLKVKHYTKLFSSKQNRNILSPNKMLYLQSLVLRNLNGVAKCYALASDVLRAFILNKGGVYFDIDVPIVKKIPDFSSTSNWFIPLYIDVDPNDNTNYDYIHYNHVFVSATSSYFAKKLITSYVEEIDSFSKKGSRMVIHMFGKSDEKLDVTWHVQRWGCKCAPYGYYNRDTMVQLLTGPYLLKRIVADVISPSYLPEKRLPISLGYEHEDLEEYSTALPLKTFRENTSKAICKGIKEGINRKSTWLHCININMPATLQGLTAEDTIKLKTSV